MLPLLSSSPSDYSYFENIFGRPITPVTNNNDDDEPFDPQSVSYDYILPPIVWWPETPSLGDSFSTDASSILVEDDEETERKPENDSEGRTMTGTSDGLGLVGVYQEDGHGGMKPFDGIGLLSQGVFINGHSTMTTRL